MINIAKKDFKNGFLNFIANFYDPILLAILTPILINNLSLEIYGIWVLIFSIANFAKLGSAGMNSSIIKFLGSFNSKKKKEKYLINILFLFISYSTVFIILISVILWIFNFDSLFNIDTIISFEYFFIIAIIFVIFKSFEECILAVYLSFEDYKSSTFLKIFSKTIIFIMQIYVIISYKDITVLLETSCITLFLIILFQVLILKKKYQIINFHNLNNLINFGIIKKYFYYSKGLIISNLINIMNLNIDKYLLAYFLGLKTLGLYNIAFLIFSLIHSVFNSFFFYLFPKMNRIKDESVRFRTFIRAEINIILIGFLSLCFILVTSNFFLKIWLGNVYDPIIYDYHRIFLLINFLILPTIPIYYYLVTLDNTSIQAKMAFYTMILSTILMIILFNFFSVYGVIFSKASMIIVSVIAFIHISKIQNK